jgi:hypothetical protein
VFVPLLRKVALLREIDFGVFSPVWPQALVETLDVLPIMEAMTQLPDAAESPDWPLVVDLPEDMKGTLITPLLSDWLKDRREEGKSLGPVVALENPHVTPLKVDQRHWDTQIERVEALAQRPNESAAFLWTPFVLQRREAKKDMVSEAHRVLEEGGLWKIVDVLPSSMAAHWLYRYFPKAWEIDRGLTWNASELYNILRQSGFAVELERKSQYRPVTVGVALEMARDRERCPQLAILPDAVYNEGVQRLEAVLEREGEEHLLPSEVCLAIVSAERRASGEEQEGD